MQEVADTTYVLEGSLKDVMTFVLGLWTFFEAALVAFCASSSFFTSLRNFLARFWTLIPVLFEGLAMVAHLGMVSGYVSEWLWLNWNVYVWWVVDWQPPILFSMLDYFGLLPTIHFF